MPECGLSNSSSASAACTNETEKWVWLEHYYWQFYNYTKAVLTISLLDHLKCAEQSSLARKGKAKTNPASVGAKKDNDWHQ